STHSCDQGGGVSWAPHGFAGDEVFAGDTARGFDDFADGIAGACTEIDCLRFNAASHQSLYSHDVRAGEIRDMDVITHAGSVGCRIICTEDFYFRTPSGCRFEHERNQVSLGIMVLS